MPALALLLVSLWLGATHVLRSTSCPCTSSTPPRRLYPLVEVLDGDTLRVRRDGEVITVRLAAVDTEERLSARPLASPDKARTVFGEATAVWLQRLLAERAAEGVGLRATGETFERDRYGRWLAHVVLPDGADLSLLLVRAGRSPYFDKYGNCAACHRALVCAQLAARLEGRGIWDPRTNAPRTAGAPAARRRYPELLAWWGARALAVEGFRNVRRSVPVIDARDADALREAATPDGAREPVVLFGELARIEELGPTGLAVELYGPDREQRVRVVVTPGTWSTLGPLRLEQRIRAPVQNYVYVRGSLRRDAHGFALDGADADSWLLAGPEPRAATCGRRKP